MATTHDHGHSHAESQGGGFWKFANYLIGLGFAALSLFIGVSLIHGAYKIHYPSPIVPVQGEFSLTITPGEVNPLEFSVKRFEVKSGDKVKLTFENKSSAPLQHNLILGKLGTKDKLMAAAMVLMTDPKGLENGYFPTANKDDVLAHTKLLNINESETVEFVAPEEKGEYPYLCTFPGHSMIMNGVMEVQ